MPDKANLPLLLKEEYYHKKVSIYGNLNLGADLSLSVWADPSFDASNTLVRNFYYFDP